MKSHIFTWLFLGILVTLSVSPIFANDVEIALITHPGVTDKLTKDEVEQIFLGKKTRWSNNTTIRFVVFTEDAVYQKFLKDYIGKTIFQYTNYWKKQVFTGKGRMPKTFETSQEILAFVSQTEGAISFVPLQAVGQNNVNIIAIEP